MINLMSRVDFNTEYSVTANRETNQHLSCKRCGNEFDFDDAIRFVMPVFDNKLDCRYCGKFTMIGPVSPRWLRILVYWFALIVFSLLFLILFAKIMGFNDWPMITSPDKYQDSIHYKAKSKIYESYTAQFLVRVTIAMTLIIPSHFISKIILQFMAWKKIGLH